MNLFGGKPSHQRSVERLVELTVRLFRALKPDRVSPSYSDLHYERPDSAYRLLLFCESAIHYACAPRMANPDAVLNESTRHLVGFALTDQQLFFGGAVDAQDAANRTALLQDFLNRWSSYEDIKGGGNPAAASGIVASMLRDVESAAPPTSDDSERLAMLASSAEHLLDKARNM